MACSEATVAVAAYDTRLVALQVHWESHFGFSCAASSEVKWTWRAWMLQQGDSSCPPLPSAGASVKRAASVNSGFAGLHFHTIE